MLLCWRTIFDVERGRTQPGIATYKDGSGTTTLHFEYIIGFDDTTLDLECNDNHSLHLGFDSVNPVCIKQASANPTIAANLELPFPGTTGSLGSNSYIKMVVDSHSSPWRVLDGPGWIFKACVYQWITISAFECRIYCVWISVQLGWKWFHWKPWLLLEWKTIYPSSSTFFHLNNDDSLQAIFDGDTMTEVTEGIAVFHDLG